MRMKIKKSFFKKKRTKEIPVIICCPFLVIFIEHFTNIFNSHFKERCTTIAPSCFDNLKLIAPNNRLQRILFCLTSWFVHSYWLSVINGLIKAQLLTVLSINTANRMSLIASIFSCKFRTRKQADDDGAVYSTLTRTSFIIKVAAERRASCLL